MQMQNKYQLKNGATIEDFLTAVATAWSIETTERGHDLLVAMLEMLSSIRNFERDTDSRGYDMQLEILEHSFLTLFRLWLGVTGLKVPTLGAVTLEAATLEDAFTVSFGASV
jgi:hypothetical protein